MKLACVSALALTCALAPASASAGVVYVHRQAGQDTIEYHAQPGERNTVDIHWQLGSRLVDLYDNSAKVTTEQLNVFLPDPNQPPPQEEFRPCQLVDDHHARCITVAPASPAYVVNAVPLADVSLGDRDDSFRPSALTEPYAVYVRGEDGNDTITLPANNQFPGSVAYGGLGDDVLTSLAFDGGQGNLLVGEEGNDRLEADNGAQESVLCGAGDDYAHVDGYPEDGVRDCETVVRGSLTG